MTVQELTTIAELRRRILYHWGMGVVRDSTGREIQFDAGLCDRMRTFADQIDGLEAPARAEFEARMTPEICTGPSCACAGIVTGIDYGSGHDKTVRVEAKREDDGSLTILDVREEPGR